MNLYYQMAVVPLSGEKTMAMQSDKDGIRLHEKGMFSEEQ